MALLQIDFILWIACLFAESILAVVLISRRLYRRYPIFLAYLIVEVASALILLKIDFQSPMYNSAYRIYESLLIVLRMAVAGEVVERFCEHLVGIGTFRFGMVAILFIVATFVAYGMWAPAPLHQSWMYAGVVVLKRFETTTLAMLLPALWFFSTRLMNVRPTFRANVSAHWKILTIYFLFSALASAAVLITGGGKAMHPINILMLLGDLGCMIAWLIYLQPRGEEYHPIAPVDPGERRIRELEIDRLLDHLKHERAVR